MIPAAPGWIDLVFGVPLLDSRRARAELGWMPTRRADQALLELLDGLHDGAGYDTPPLSARRGMARTAPADPRSLRGRLVHETTG